MLNAHELLQEKLARSLGLDGYAAIMQGKDDIDSPDFQRKFNGFYRVRRNGEWRTIYYDLFKKARNQHWSFAQIITEIYRSTGNVEASFSSKMLATIDPDKPIWDQFVLKGLGLKLKGTTPEEKLHNAIALYRRIEKWYADYLLTEEARQNIAEFDRILPDYTWLSDTKKIDFLLWISGEQRKTDVVD